MDTQEQALTAQDIWKLFRETDRMFRETDRKFVELSKTVKNTNKKVGELTDKWGEFVESMVEPAIVRLFAERGIPLEGTQLRSKRHRDGREMEIDVLGVNQEYVVAVEVKTTLKVDDVNRFVEKLKEFKTFFPRFSEQKLIGAVAGMHLPEGVDKYAERQRLYVLAQSGETVQVLNSEDFEARVW